MTLKAWLSNPLTRGMDIDDPKTTELRRHVIQEKSFLRKIYLEWYSAIDAALPTGSGIVMIEPWVTSWSRLIYSKLHHVPFRPEAPEWEFQQRGPLSGANIALPWIIFQRDRKRFESEFPQWHLRTVKLMMPFSYIVSGGVSLRSLSPGWSYGLWSTLEHTLRPLMPKLAMFAQIVLQKLSY